MRFEVGKLVKGEPGSHQGDSPKSSWNLDYINLMRKFNIFTQKKISIKRNPPFRFPIDLSIS